MISWIIYFNLEAARFAHPQYRKFNDEACNMKL